VELLPERKPRTALRDRYLNYTIYCTPDMRTLIQQRTEKDIWQHLYEFPLQEAEALLPVAAGVAHVDLKHILSHQRIHARFHIRKVEQLPQIPNTIAIPLASLDDYALSRLTLRALDMLLV
jgi:A/G-specific adenine glycosylase